MNKRIVKYNIEEIKKVAKERNCLLLETKYINVKSKMKFRCKCGNEFISSLDKFIHKNQNSCLICSKEEIKNKLKHNLEHIKHRVAELGCSFKSCDYKNTKSIVFMNCSCGNIIQRAFANIRPNKDGKMVCEKCRYSKQSLHQKHSDDYVKSTIEFSGCVWISGSYINNDSELCIKCKCGNNFYTNFNNFTNKKKPKIQCNDCGFKKRTNSLRFSFNHVKDEIESKGCRLISDFYENDGSKITIQCNCGNLFNTTFINFVSKSKNRCDECTRKKSKGEIEIERILLENDIPYKTQFSIAECKYKSPLKFDFCIFESKDFDKIRLLLEYDGEQHFEPISRFGGESSFYSQLEKDRIKNEYCAKNNLRLERVPYYDFKNIKQIILDIMNI